MSQETATPLLTFSHSSEPTSVALCYRLLYFFLLIPFHAPDASVCRSPSSPPGTRAHLLLVVYQLQGPCIRHVLGVEDVKHAVQRAIARHLRAKGRQDYCMKMTNMAFLSNEWVQD